MLTKRNYDKAIAAFDAAHAADPDGPAISIARGFAYEAKGDDEHAMADYNLVLQDASQRRSRPQQPRHAVSCARARCKARSTISTPRSTPTPNLYLARINRGHVLTVNKDYDGALADFAEAERIDPAAPRPPQLSLHDLYRDGQVRRGAGRHATA